MELVEATIKEEGRQHVHGWENVTLLEKEETGLEIIRPLNS